MASQKENIKAYIRKNGQATVAELDDAMVIGRVMIHRHLKALVTDGQLQKIGTPPKVFYVLSEENAVQPTLPRGSQAGAQWDVVAEHFLTITPSGERLSGVAGFLMWCRERKYDVEKKALEYEGVFRKYAALREGLLLDGTKKIQSTFQSPCIDHVYYIDFYAWEVFGKTKLGQLLLYAKQSQDMRMMKEIATYLTIPVAQLVQQYHIDAIGYIPPTVKRTLQLMDVLEKQSPHTLPTLRIEKAVREVRVPQKTLSKLSDRIMNAQATIFVTDRRAFETVLLIDDAVGSGATMHEVACKLKKQGVARQVIGLAITGSAKGFDVISEV